MTEFEIKIVKYLNQINNRKLDNFLAFVNSVIFLAFFWIVITIIAAVRHPAIAWKFIPAVLVVTVFHFAITEGLIKHFLTRFYPKRKRPYVAYPELIRPIGKKFSDSSFPSSHMTTTVAMLFVIVNFYPSLFVLALALVVAMAFSRLHNGMHYPTDIVAGIILGFGYAWAALEVVKIFF